MGFRPPRNVYNLTWAEDSELYGLQVMVTADSADAEFAVLDYLKAVAARAVTAKTLQALFAPFVASVVAWNLEDRAGRPVPVTAKGLTAQPRELVRALLRQWVELVQGELMPAAPAAEPADDEPEEFDESEIPMTALPVDEPLPVAS